MDLSNWYKMITSGFLLDPTAPFPILRLNCAEFLLSELFTSKESEVTNSTLKIGYSAERTALVGLVKLPHFLWEISVTRQFFSESTIEPRASERHLKEVFG